VHEQLNCNTAVMQPAPSLRCITDTSYGCGVKCKLNCFATSAENEHDLSERLPS